MTISKKKMNKRLKEDEKNPGGLNYGFLASGEVRAIYLRLDVVFRI
jgi:hypothetical protein